MFCKSPQSAPRRSLSWRTLKLLTLTIPCAVSMRGIALAADGQYIANNAPEFVTSAQKLGATRPSLVIQVSVWLKPHNRAELDALAQELYEPSSPRYRHWLTSAEVAARFAPSAPEAQRVKEFLESHQLTVSSIGSDNFYVRASGTIAQVEKAFAVHINDYTISGRTVRGNSADPYIEGPAADLIQAVSGLDDGPFHGPGTAPSNIFAASGPGIAHEQRDTPSGGSAMSGFQSNCFPGTATAHQSTLGGYPKATYTGNEYVSSDGGCGYTPANIRTAYNLNALYAEGYDGTGQTIVLIEPCGSPTLLSDANTFSERFGLPKLTASNFTITSMGPSTCAGFNPNINADLEWAHAIAPGASLVVIFALSGAPQDTDEAMFYAVNHQLGTVICYDNEFSESLIPQTQAEQENLVSEIAAMEGISANYPGGVGGGELRFGSPVVAPADGPYATGIGGITLAIGADGSIAFETGWEDHASHVFSSGAVYDPPAAATGGGYIYGGLGGPSAYFAKPTFQNAAVAGTQRAIPDFAWVADPFTGLITVATTSTQEPPQSWFTFGSTGVATSMFSGLWAIANQRAGIALGQAARYLYALPARAATDIVPYSSSNDVIGSVQETSSSNARFDAFETLAITQPSMFGPFYSALWKEPLGEEDTAWVLSFGEDFNMKTAVGWDEVTGMGAPLDAKAFVDWVGGNNQ